MKIYFRFSYVYQMFSPYKRLFINVIPMHPTGKPTGYGPSSRRSHNRGIVDECCFQSCELRRLEMYCAPVKTGKTPRSLRAQRHTDITRTAKVCSHADDVTLDTFLSSASSVIVICSIIVTLVSTVFKMGLCKVVRRVFDTILHYCKTLGQVLC